MARVADTYGITLPVHEVFARPTVAELAEVISAHPDFGNAATSSRVAELDAPSDEDLDDLCVPRSPNAIAVKPAPAVRIHRAAERLRCMRCLTGEPPFVASHQHRDPQRRRCDLSDRQSHRTRARSRAVSQPDAVHVDQ